MAMREQMKNMPNNSDWLQAEESGDEVLAETLFARVIAGMPAIEPGADFVPRTVHAAWRARARRRLVTRLARIAAALVVTIAGLGSIYALSGAALALLIPGTVALSRGFLWLITSAGDGAGWWWVADRIGTAIADIVGDPVAASAVAAAALMALVAIYAFHHLIHNEFASPES